MSTPSNIFRIHPEHVPQNASIQARQKSFISSESKVEAFYFFEVLY